MGEENKQNMDDVIDEIMPGASKTQVDESVSGIGTAIKIFSAAEIILCVFGCLALIGKYPPLYIGAGFVASALIGMIGYGIGEICCLLKSLDSKMK